VAEIRLEGVSKIFRSGTLKWLPAGRGARFAYRDYADKSFVERVAGQAVPCMPWMISP
jgi:hypothetical protein